MTGEWLVPFAIVGLAFLGAGLSLCRCCTIPVVCCDFTEYQTFLATLSASTVACFGASASSCVLVYDGVCWTCSIPINCLDHGSLAWDTLTIVLCCGPDDTMCGHIVLTGPASTPPAAPFEGCEHCTPCFSWDLTLTCSSFAGRVGCCLESEVSIVITPI